MSALGYHSTHRMLDGDTRGGAMIVDIARDFSAITGGRYRRLGPFSGEEFRETVLAPKLRAAIDRGENLIVRIDSHHRSFQPSFLDEAFAGLIRDEGFSASDIDAHLRIEASAPKFQKFKTLAEKYIEEARGDS